MAESTRQRQLGDGRGGESRFSTCIGAKGKNSICINGVDEGEKSIAYGRGHDTLLARLIINDSCAVTGGRRVYRAMGVHLLAILYLVTISEQWMPSRQVSKERNMGKGGIGRQVCRR